MKKFINPAMSFPQDEEGGSSVEYALLLGLIAVVIIAGVGTFGTSLSAYYNSLSGRLPW
ncbi:MAG: Flp family type IVb pilin [Thermodesulfobacteriota bacterium]